MAGHNFQDKAAGFVRTAGILKIFIMAYVFLIPLEGLWPLRTAAFAAVVSALFFKAAKKGLKVNFRDWSNLGIALFFGVTLIGALLSPYRSESLKAFFGGAFTQAVIFFAVATEYEGFDSLKPFFLALFAGFALYTLTTAYQFAFLSPSWPALREFAYFTALYAPLALAYLLTSGSGLKDKRYVLYMCVPGIFLALFSGSVAEIAAILASFGYMLVLSGRFRFFSGFAAAFVSAAVILFIVMPAAPAEPAVDAVAAPVKIEDGLYGAKFGRSNKDREHWRMTLDLLMTRPFFGFGYGRDRLRSAAADAGYLNGIERSDATYAFFDRGFLRQAGSHNAFIEALFEAGIAGLLAYAFFWFTILRKTKGVFLAVSKSPSAVFLRIGVMGFILALLAVSMVESLWDGRSGVLIVAVAAVSFVLYREFEALPKDYRTVWVFKR